jgi:iron-sulfur cluster assembly protein
MLTLTENAVSAIRSLTSQPEQPADAGLRIMGQGEEATPFELALAETPADGDQVIEEDGARVFLDPSAALALSGSALDARVDDRGGVAFSVSPQPG